MKTTFHQLSLVSAFLLTLSAVAYNGLLAAKAESPNPSPQYSFDDYKKECIQRSMAEGLPLEEAETLCTCTINEFQARYTIEEFKKLTQEAKENEEAAEMLTEVGYSCFEEILFEE
ncbi:MAG: hypothetical protein AB4426_20070 [Xenococcaceae cyanobacterium]